MAKHKYRAKVTVEGNIEETQFVPLSGDTPRARTRYMRDAKEHGKYKHGREYLIDPEKLEAEAEEALAEAQQEQQAEAADAMRAEEKAARKGKK